MSTLQIGQLKCHEETDEVGSDDIYFVVGIGRRSSPKKGEIKVITSSNWLDLRPRESSEPLKASFELQAGPGLGVASPYEGSRCQTR